MNKGSLLRCNDCNGVMFVKDSRVLHPDRNNNVYRKRLYQCKGCGCKIYTLEKLKDMHLEGVKQYVTKMGLS